MSEQRSTSLSSGSRLLTAVAVTAALAAIGLTVARDAEGVSPSGMVPAMATVPPSGSRSATGPGTPVPTVPSSPSNPPRTTRPPSPSPSVPFPPPTNFAATGVRANAVTLSWTAPSSGEVTGYTISYNRAFDDIHRLHQVGNATTTTITEGIYPASEYSFRLSAHDAAGRRSPVWDTVVVVTPLSDTGPDTTPPSAPTDLTLTGISSAGAGLSWQPSTDNVGVTGYNVYWFDGVFLSRLVATVTGTSYTAPLSGPNNRFYVRARDAAGNVSIATGTAVATSTTAPPTTPSSTPPQPICRVNYRITAQWATGFVATVTIGNSGPAPLNGWELVFGLGGGQRVTSSWSSTFSQSEDWVTLKNASWNGAIEMGAATTVGVVGSWPMISAPPPFFTLNGRPCAAG